jgi:hypothetical protein
MFDKQGTLKASNYHFYKSLTKRHILGDNSYKNKVALVFNQGEYYF